MSSVSNITQTVAAATYRRDQLTPTVVYSTIWQSRVCLLRSYRISRLSLWQKLPH